jgi:hypothetical protein
MVGTRGQGKVRYMWTKQSKKWYADWILENHEFWLDPQVSWAKKYKRVFDDNPPDLLFPVASIGSETFKHGWAKLYAEYKLWASRFRGTGEGLTEKEASDGYNNLYGISCAMYAHCRGCRG